MSKIICALMALVVILSVFYSNPVESRIIHQNFEGIPASQFHHLRFDDRRTVRENHHDDEQDAYDHVKRKSDFLLSLYGLPYTLVNNKREVE